MNREIKFRGKKEKTGEWVIGFFAYLYAPDTSDSGHITQGFTAIPSIFNDGIGNRDGSFWNTIEQNTLGQFTGVKDINDREIYEGDIVRVRVTNNRFKKNPRFRNGVVTFCKYDGGWSNGCYPRFIPGRMEVIGNIHDNPNLIKGGQQ